MLKEKLISTIRVGVAAVAGMLLSWLAQAGFIDEEASATIQRLVTDVSFVAGSVAWYFIARLLETRFPWLLAVATPKSIPQTPPPRSRL